MILWIIIGWEGGSVDGGDWGREREREGRGREEGLGRDDVIGYNFDNQ